MRKLFVLVVAAAAAGLLALSVATSGASVTFDPNSGTGFVGKGDVQLVYGWNNAALQANAPNVRFRASSTEITEVSWTCDNTDNPNVQDQIRTRTTTTSLQGVVSSIGRERNQFTGFNLNGYSSTPTQSSQTDGPPLNSCPGGPWVLSVPAGDPVVVGGGGSQLQVSIDGVTWYNI